MEEEYTEKEKTIKWFLKEIVGEHLFFLLDAFVEFSARDELEKKVDDIIKFTINHLKKN
ncbi:MAG: hypothetical protein J7J44_08780 [Deltaproteobacteria bacterium]|nr:hypothetical protein [Deltaproteobacteria bacterium]